MRVKPIDAPAHSDRRGAAHTASAPKLPSQPPMPSKLKKRPGKQTTGAMAALSLEDPDVAGAAVGPSSPEPQPAPPEAFRALPSHAVGRRNRQYGTCRLPTLDESDSSDVDSSLEDEPMEAAPHDATAAASPPRKGAAAAASPRTRDKVQPFNGRAASGAAAPSAAAAAGRPKAAASVGERVAGLMARAADCAAVGNDDAAVAQYRLGLRLTRAETAKIKQQLRQVEGKHPTTIASIHSRLHEDWLDVGRCIAEIRQHMAVLCERVGDYPRALSCGREARVVLERNRAFMAKRSKTYLGRMEETDRRIKELDDLLEKMKLAQASFDDRKAMHEQIVLMRKQIDAEHDPKKRQDLLTNTTLKVQKALQTEKRVLGLRHPQIADTFCCLATLSYERGMVESSREFIREALEISLDVLGDRHPSTAEVYLQAARLYAAQDEKQAMDYYNRSVAIFRGASQHAMVGSTLNEIAVLQIRHKRYQEAIAMLVESLEAVHTEDEPAVSAISAQIHRNLGECYSSLKDHQKAVSSYLRAVDIQKESRPDPESIAADSVRHPDEILEEENFADTLRRLGKSYMYCGKSSEALKSYGEALQIHRSHVIQAAHPGRPSRALPERQDQLAHTLFCMAEVRETIGDLDEALNVYSESMQLRLFSDAHRAEKRLNMVHCAMCLRGIGNVHLAKREYEAAKKVFEDALRYCEAHGLPDAHAIVVMIKKQLAESSRLAEDHGEQKSDKDELSSPKRRFPVDTELRPEEESRYRDDIERLERQAADYIERDELDNAIESLTRLMAARKTLLKLLKASNKDASHDKHATACTLVTFGKVLLKTGDPTNAERALQDAIKLFKKSRSTGDAEGVKEAQLALTELGGVQQ